MLEKDNIIKEDILEEDTLNEELYIPLYIQLKEKLKESIYNRWDVDEKIPSENSLIQKYGISRTTVRSAVQELINEGLLYSKQGKGTFVSPPKIEHSLNSLTASFTEEIIQKNKNPGSIERELSLKNASDKIKKYLNLKDDKSIYIERIRTINGERVGLHKIYLNPELVSWDKFSNIELENKSLYKTLNNTFGLKISKAKETIESSLVDLRLSKILNTKKGRSLLRLERTSYTQFSKPLEFAIMEYRGDKYKYSISNME